MGYQEIHSKRGARATRAAERKRQGGGMTGSSNKESESSGNGEGGSEGGSNEGDGGRV